MAPLYMILLILVTINFSTLAMDYSAIKESKKSNKAFLEAKLRSVVKFAKGWQKLFKSEIDIESCDKNEKTPLIHSEDGGDNDDNELRLLSNISIVRLKQNKLQVSKYTKHKNKLHKEINIVLKSYKDSIDKSQLDNLSSAINEKFIEEKINKYEVRIKKYENELSRYKKSKKILYS